MPANLENSAVTTGLEKVSFHCNSKERQCQISYVSKVMLKIHKTNILASGPITSWQIDGEEMETVIDFILGGSQITADGDCSHENKRHLLLGRKAMTKLASYYKAEISLC